MILVLIILSDSYPPEMISFLKSCFGRQMEEKSGNAPTMLEVRGSLRDECCYYHMTGTSLWRQAAEYYFRDMPLWHTNQTYKNFIIEVAGRLAEHDLRLAFASKWHTKEDNGHFQYRMTLRVPGYDKSSRESPREVGFLGQMFNPRRDLESLWIPYSVRLSGPCPRNSKESKRQLGGRGRLRLSCLRDHFWKIETRGDVGIQGLSSFRRSPRSKMSTLYPSELYYVWPGSQLFRPRPGRGGTGNCREMDTFCPISALTPNRIYQTKPGHMISTWRKSNLHPQVKRSRPFNVNIFLMLRI